MVVLAVGALIATHVSHVILRDVAETATAGSGQSREPVSAQRAVSRETTDALLQGRDASGGRSEEEFDRLIDGLGESSGQGTEPTDRVRE
jgi:hypothetical protein